MHKLKRVLVDSYIGAIGLGYLLAEILEHFVNIFASPVAIWVTQTGFFLRGPRTVILGQASRPSPIAYAIPELVRFVVLLLLWFVLLYWLYLKPEQPDESAKPVAPAPEAGPAD